MSEKTVTIPVDPPMGLLISMAIRNDHGLAVPGYYDHALFKDSGLTHRDRLESAISQMRKLYEEIVGKGFYGEERDAWYRDIAERSGIQLTGPSLTSPAAT